MELGLYILCDIYGVKKICSNVGNRLVLPLRNSQCDGRGGTSSCSSVQESLGALWAMVWRTIPLRKTTLFFCVPSLSPSPPSQKKMCLTEMFEHGLQYPKSHFALQSYLMG